MAILLLSSCVTERKKSDIKGTKKFYHNTTAYYNAFFNAEELMAESVMNMQSAHIDNYNDLISVYDYTNLQNPRIEASNLDIAVEKVSKSASLHRQSHWVDDCYVLIGKAQFYKQDYETAEETLMFFEEEFDPFNPYGKNYDPSKEASRAEKEKQRKIEKKAKEAERKEEVEQREKSEKEKQKERKAAQKERERLKKEQMKDRKRNGGRSGTKTRAPKTETPTKEEVKEEKKEEEEKKKEEEKEKEEEIDELSDGLFGHTTAYWNGLYWLARTLIERENYSSAEYYLNKISGSNAQEEVRSEIPAARAHLNIKNEDYDAALDYLNEAIAVSKDKFAKARYAYIRAQIFERLGNPNAAFAEFERCRSFKPDFEMAFYADINDLKLSHSIGTINSKSAIKKMERMLEEDKYLDFRGPIYFSIGEVLLNDGNTEAAITAFKTATGEGGTQDPDLFYRLANLLFDQQDYASAKQYFDKTLEYMPKSDSRYPQVRKYANSLKDISLTIEQIDLQDSLLTLASLPEDELRERAIEAIKNRPEEEVLAGNPNAPSQTTNNGVGRRYGSGQSSFFAYNPIALNQGKSEFVREWGDRPLEDNWRRSSIGASFTDEIAEDTGEKEISEEEIDAFISNIPTSKLAEETAKRKLSTALFDLGFMYRERLQNYKKSSETLDRIVEEFPSFQKMDQVYFYQYLNNQDLGNTSKAQRFVNLMKEEYPDSRYTKIATDPNYVKKELAAENELDDFYNETYSYFENKDFETVINRAMKSAKQFGENNEFAPKFSLLSAMSIGSTKGKEEYIKALDQLVKRYPNTPEQTRAKEILRFLKGDEEAFNSILYDEETQKFEKNKDGLHYVVVVLYDASGSDVDQAKISISGFNRQFFKSDRLQQSDISLNRDLNSHLILIRKYSNEARAMDYWKTVQKNEDKFMTTGANYEFYPVTQNNYREIIKQKSINAYRAYFEKEYLGN